MIHLNLSYENSADGYYDLGFQIGTKVKEYSIPTRLPIDIPQSIEGYSQLLQEFYPLIYAEVKGLATGMNVSVDQLLASLYFQAQAISESSQVDLQVKNEDFIGWGHLETGEIPKLVITGTRVDQNGRIELTWCCISYPLLSRSALGLNSKGVLFTSCDLHLSESPIEGNSKLGVPASFLQRMALESADVSELINIVTSEHLLNGRGYTFSNFLRSPNDPSIHFIETAPGGSFQVEEISTVGCHTNHFLYLSMKRNPKIERKGVEIFEQFLNERQLIRDSADILEFFKNLVAGHNKQSMVLLLDLKERKAAVYEGDKNFLEISLSQNSNNWFI
jgi:Acyl-coenzyme A:6-aminopenicillanic acid acyl-transferase